MPAGQIQLMRSAPSEGYFADELIKMSQAHFSRQSARMAKVVKIAHMGRIMAHQQEGLTKEAITGSLAKTMIGTATKASKKLVPGVKGAPKVQAGGAGRLTTPNQPPQNMTMGRQPTMSGQGTPPRPAQPLNVTNRQPTMQGSPPPRVQPQNVASRQQTMPGQGAQSVRTQPSPPPQNMTMGRQPTMAAPPPAAPPVKRSPFRPLEPHEWASPKARAEARALQPKGQDPFRPIEFHEFSPEIQASDLRLFASRGSQGAAGGLRAPTGRAPIGPGTPKPSSPSTAGRVDVTTNTVPSKKAPGAKVDPWHETAPGGAGKVDPSANTGAKVDPWHETAPGGAGKVDPSANTVASRPQGAGKVDPLSRDTMVGSQPAGMGAGADIPPFPRSNRIPTFPDKPGAGQINPHAKTIADAPARGFDNTVVNKSSPTMVQDAPQGFGGGDTMVGRPDLPMKGGAPKPRSKGGGKKQPFRAGQDPNKVDPLGRTMAGDATAPAGTSPQGQAPAPPAGAAGEVVVDAGSQAKKPWIGRRVADAVGNAVHGNPVAEGAGAIQRAGHHAVQLGMGAAGYGPNVASQIGGSMLGAAALRLGSKMNVRKAAKVLDKNIMSASGSAVKSVDDIGGLGLRYFDDAAASAAATKGMSPRQLGAIDELLEYGSQADFPAALRQKLERAAGMSHSQIIEAGGVSNAIQRFGKGAHSGAGEVTGGLWGRLNQPVGGVAGLGWTAAKIGLPIAGGLGIYGAYQGMNALSQANKNSQFQYGSQGAPLNYSPTAMFPAGQIAY